MPMDELDLGSYSRQITASSPQAQHAFGRGLIWIYAYNHEAAIGCFERALAQDPYCCMAHWGIAYCVGPNYNKPWESFEDDERRQALKTAQRAITLANAQQGRATPVERALVEAIALRYPSSCEVDSFAPWNDAYADAMRGVFERFADDLDVSALFAEALMNRTPWQLWDLSSGQPAEGASTEEAICVLEHAFGNLPGSWEHPGLLHLYIHLMEMSPHPEKALRHGDRLARLVPDAGHLLHMPTHIDVLCGDYIQVVSRNQVAIRADRRFFEQNDQAMFYSLYRLHNLHFAIYGAMFLGQPSVAFSMADELKTILTDAIVRPLADWFEAFVPIRQHVLIRFGFWERILEQSLPADAELYCVTTATMLYARAVALANVGSSAEAFRAAEAFEEACQRVPESRMLFNNTCLDILAVARAMMRGELDYHRGQHSQAFDHLRRAVQLDDNLPYDEPWGWMQPTRHALGALLLEQGFHAEAEAIYRADLGLDATLSRACQHPNNVWSLHGLRECLIHRQEDVELPLIQQQLDKALARAEIPIQASCYCRRPCRAQPEAASADA